MFYYLIINRSYFIDFFNLRLYGAGIFSLATDYGAEIFAKQSARRWNFLIKP